MGLTVSSLNTLFSSFGNTSSKTSGFGFDTSFLSDYNSIRNGSYYKLLKAYYAKDETAAKTTSSTIKNSVSGTADTKTDLTRMNSTASDLKTSVYNLMRTGSKSVFNTKEVTAEDGTKTQEYDTDAIYKSVKSFVDSYNSVVAQADVVNNTSVKRSTINMINMTSKNSSSLAALGITIGSDYQLSIDETVFKEADMTKAKSLFQGAGSYADHVSTYSSMIMNTSVSALNSGGIYSSGGVVTSSDLVGSLFSSIS